jgi:hypothetical protein
MFLKTIKTFVGELFECFVTAKEFMKSLKLIVYYCLEAAFRITFMTLPLT